jgi:hypothetical protein
LQYGATLENMKSAITRNSNGEPSTVVGAVIDRLIVVEAISASSA